MKSFSPLLKKWLRCFGLVLMMAGVGLLVACHFIGLTDDNGWLSLSAFLVVGGLIVYIVLQKKLPVG